MRAAVLESTTSSLINVMRPALLTFTTQSAINGKVVAGGKIEVVPGTSGYVAAVHYPDQTALGTAAVSNGQPTQVIVAQETEQALIRAYGFASEATFNAWKSNPLRGKIAFGTPPKAAENGAGDTGAGGGQV